VRMAQRRDRPGSKRFRNRVGKRRQAQCGMDLFG